MWFSGPHPQVSDSVGWGRGLRICIFQVSQVLPLFSHNEKHRAQLKESKLKEATNPPLKMASGSQSNSFQAVWKHGIQPLTSHTSPGPFNLLSTQACSRSCWLGQTSHPSGTCGPCYVLAFSNSSPPELTFWPQTPVHQCPVSFVDPSSSFVSSW